MQILYTGIPSPVFQFPPLLVFSSQPCSSAAVLVPQYCLCELAGASWKDVTIHDGTSSLLSLPETVAVNLWQLSSTCILGYLFLIPDDVLFIFHLLISILPLST